MPARTPARILALATGLALVAGVGVARSSSASSSGVYVVQAGDSLWRIAGTDGITVAQLAAANGLSPNGILQIGTRLTIPVASSSTAAAAATSSSATSSSAPESGSDGDSDDTVSAPVSSASVSPASSVSTVSTVSAASSFCATFTPEGGPQGLLPALLAASPDRLALRPLFVEWADHYGVSPALVEAIGWQESGWQQGVVSSAQAVGVGQIIPSTAAFVQTNLVGFSLDITAASDNIRMSAAFLAYLSRQENGNLCNTIAAYYEGPLNLSLYGVFTMTEPYVANVEALLPRFQ